jgi:hypothetical protein
MIEPYYIHFSSNIDIFSSIKNVDLTDFDDDKVVEQVKQVLLHIYLTLKHASKRRPIRNYLSRISLVRQEDEAAIVGMELPRFSHWIPFGTG